MATDSPAPPCSNVLPLRPRDQVPRRIEVGDFRSDPGDIEVRIGLWPRLRLRGDVRMRQVLRALASVGLSFGTDQRSGDLVVFPGDHGSASERIVEPIGEELSAFLLAKRIERLPRDRYHEVCDLVEQLESKDAVKP